MSAQILEFPARPRPRVIPIRAPYQPSRLDAFLMAAGQLSALSMLGLPLYCIAAFFGLVPWWSGL